MLHVLLVDDEPFILQGLQVLIDWKSLGFEVVATASNGREALEVIAEKKIDLIIADIKMPEMNGLELLEAIRTNELSNAFFIVLSGYAEFSYAQQAMKYNCVDYILKPVDKDKLESVLQRVIELKEEQDKISEGDLKLEEECLTRNLLAVIRGKYDDENLTYVKEHLRSSDAMRYVGIEISDWGVKEEPSDQEKRNLQKELYRYCQEYLKEEKDHCIFDVSAQEKIYDVGFIFCNYMAEEAGVSESRYFQLFLDYLKQCLNVEIAMFLGKPASSMDRIARSYGNACMLRSFRGFREKKSIYFYEHEAQVSSNGMILCKDSVDDLIKAVEENQHARIHQAVEAFYGQMCSMGMGEETKTLNLNYLLFQLIQLASEQDDGVNQEEILRLISESSFQDGIRRGSCAHLARFACQYGDYLSQLRKNVSRGVIAEIEREIREHYEENLTLKGLSEKYFVNSAYLGQLFRKKHGQSFKDYLNSYRMEQAAKLLLHTDLRIIEVAEQVGYHDLDYFVNRFIGVKGCTPAKYRKQVNVG